MTQENQTEARAKGERRSTHNAGRAREDGRWTNWVRVKNESQRGNGRGTVDGGESEDGGRARSAENDQQQWERREATRQ